MWCGELSLKEAFLVLYDIACVKVVHVVVDMDLLEWFPLVEY